MKVCILVSLSVFLAVTQGQVCPTGWFGANCKFQCHCNNNVCDINGKCQDGRKCANGWFGPQCQYQDLSVYSQISTNPPHDGTVLFDNDDDTCIRNIDNVAVEFDRPYPLFWLRVVGNNLNTLGASSLHFKEDRSNFTFRACDVFKMYVSADQSMADLFCTPDVNVVTVQLSFGSREICSVYISGGRNVALKQNTFQSKDLTIDDFAYEAKYAVDGNNDINFASNSCSHTANDIHEPFWVLNLYGPAYVNRIVVYNRKDSDTGCCPQRLNGFNLKLYNELQQDIYSYNDTSTKKHKSYTIIEPNLHVVTYAAVIKVINSDSYLALCEVEVYGYDVCPAGKYGLECTKTCNCADVNETCNAQTGACVSGCPPNFRGEACDIDCRPGSTNIECYPPCNSSCLNSLCDRITGACLIDCSDPNNTAVECNLECSDKVFDQQCHYTCHCTNNGCDTLGSCLPGSVCDRGWFGAACQYQDIAANGTIITWPLHSPDHIIDGDDATCILDLENIQVNFGEPSAFTWFRLVVLEHDEEHTRPTILFGNHQTGVTSTCVNMVEDKLDRKTTDYYCDLDTLVDFMNITLSKSRSVCSFHISGGRNIAVNLKEFTRQSSNYVGNGYHSVGSSFAVDGLTQDGDQCARTDLRDPNPFWNITLPRPHIVTRFVVYNGVSVTGSRQAFTVIAEDSQGNAIFQQSVSGTQSFNSIAVANLSVPVKYVRIVPGAGAEQLLTLCEVEVYGDVVCPAGWFGPECDRKCNCANPSEACLVSSGGCQYGCAAGYRGEGCSTPCSPGTWGVGCFNICNEDCVNDECDSFNGTCIREHPAPYLSWLDLGQDVRFTGQELQDFLGRN